MPDRWAEFDAEFWTPVCAREIEGNPLPPARVFGQNLVQLGEGLYELSRQRR